MGREEGIDEQKFESEIEDVWARKAPLETLVLKDALQKTAVKDVLETGKPLLTMPP